MRKAISFVRSVDVRLVLICTLILVSTGHVGRLFADREDVRQAFVGYVLALSVDGVLAVSLYEVANVRMRSRRVFALFVFLVACALSGGFNYAYYRQNYPGDPWEISLMLGLAAPILAAFVAVLRAFGDLQRTQDAQAEQDAVHKLELDKYAIEQAERTKQMEIAEREQTKRARAAARAEQARATERTAGVRRERTNGRRPSGSHDEAARLLLLANPDLGPRPLARELGVSPSTAAGILDRVKVNGNGRG